ELELNTLIASEIVNNEAEPDSEPESETEEEFEEQVGDWSQVPDSRPETAPASPTPAPAARGGEAETSGHSTGPGLAPEDEWPDVPRSDEPEQIAGLHMHTHGPDDPVRIDSRGRI